MKVTLPTSGGYLVLLQDGVAQWMLPTYGLPIHVSVKGRPAWASGPTIDGSFHSLDLSTKPSTGDQNENSGNDTG